jgi:hypothetical protein
LARRLWAARWPPRVAATTKSAPDLDTTDEIVVPEPSLQGNLVRRRRLRLSGPSTAALPRQSLKCPFDPADDAACASFSIANTPTAERPEMDAVTRPTQWQLRPQSNALATRKPLMLLGRSDR